MHGENRIKFVNAKQAKCIHRFRVHLVGEKHCLKSSILQTTVLYSSVLLETVASFFFMASHKLHACCRLHDSGNIRASKKIILCIKSFLSLW